LHTLDIGCGSKKHGSVGVDLRSVADVKADAHFLPFKTGCFSKCYIFMCLEHVAHPDKVLSEVKRVLSVGGVVVGSVPLHSKMSFYQLKQIVLLRLRFAYYVYRALYMGEHRWQYSVKGLSTLLRQCGFGSYSVSVRRIFPYLDGEIVFAANAEVFTK
jgi:ubiquinone/menaquinone biosynthesis C-methylase UbiE